MRDASTRDARNEIVLVGVDYVDLDKLPRSQRLPVVDAYDAVDFRSICLGARDGPVGIDRVDDHRDARADLTLEAHRGNLGLHLHEAFEPFFLDPFRYRIGQRIRLRAVDGRICKRTDTIELRFAQKREQLFELGFGLARKTDDERAAHGQIRARGSPRVHAREHFFNRTWTFHQFEDARIRVLEWNIQIRKDATFRHQRNHVVDVRIRIDVVQTHPYTELG